VKHNRRMAAALRRENSDLFDTRAVRVGHSHGEDDDDDDVGDDVLEKVFAAVDEATAARRASDEYPESTLEEEMDPRALDRQTEFRKRAERLIVKNAVKSRIFVFIVGFASTMVGTPFDSSTALHIENVPGFLQCPANWDGAFNVKIATKGYEYEESHAFFPLFPFVARLLSRAFVFRWVTSNEILAVAVAGALWNNVLFVLSAILMFRIGCRVLQDERLALRAALLFAWTPASIFFSVAYSESIFFFLALFGIYILAGSYTFRARLAATACFALATTARSNGALLGLYSLWAAYRAWEKDKSKERYVRAVVELGIVGGIHLAALLAVLGYGWYLYCALPVADEQRRPWCHYKIPNIYGFIEEHYWNLGLFKYYEPKQIPNFVLAAPAFILSVRAVIHSLTQQQRPLSILAPFVLQMVVSIVVAALIMHVQVFTRLIGASSPLFYWYAAEVTSKKGAFSYLVYMYFVFYTMFGTAMFCSYFPWT